MTNKELEEERANHLSLESVGLAHKIQDLLDTHEFNCLEDEEDRKAVKYVAMLMVGKVFSRQFLPVIYDTLNQVAVELLATYESFRHEDMPKA